MESLLLKLFETGLLINPLTKLLELIFFQFGKEERVKLYIQHQKAKIKK
jgi:hypothetical protein